MANGARKIKQHLYERFEPNLVLALQCTQVMCGGKDFCEHIEEAVLNGLDVVPIEEWPFQVKVPIYRNPHVEDIVLLGDLVNGARPMALKWTSPLSVDKEGFIGFLEEGEGRRAMRNAVLTRYYSLADEDFVACGSRFHKNDLDRATNGLSHLYLADLVSRARTQTCLSCLEKEKAMETANDS